MDLRARINQEYHDASVDGHLGHEKTFAAVSRDFLAPYVQMGAQLDLYVRDLLTSEAIYIVAGTPETITNCS